MARKEGIASDEQSQAEARERDKLEEQQRIADTREVMSTAAGRRFVWWLLGAARVAETAVARDAHRLVHEPTTLVLAGYRELGLELLKRVAHDAPDEHLEMQREARLAADRVRLADEARAKKRGPSTEETEGE